MFVPAIKGQGTEEQQQKWLPLAYKMQIIGCYAQIELGHGSNVQGLEPTATFDPQTDEFVIHSPTLTSSKITDLLVNIAKHVLKPTHQVLYDKEKQNLLKKFSLEDKQIDDVGMDTK